jgi:hypothetical protein
MPGVASIALSALQWTTIDQRKRRPTRSRPSDFCRVLGDALRDEQPTAVPTQSNVSTPQRRIGFPAEIKTVHDPELRFKVIPVTSIY